MKVAVIGAGIGGLSVAVGLQRAGAEVVVYEREQDVRAGGSALSIFANGIRALDEIGLGEGFRAITSTKAGDYRGGQRKPDGTWLSTYPRDAITDLRIVDRAELHELLHSALTSGTVRTAHEVTNVSIEGKVAVRGEGANTEEAFDVVVAADGIRSTVRASWPADPGITYSGYSTWRGITDGPFDLNGEAGETWGVRLRFGIAPLADERAYWFAVVSKPRNESFDVSRAHIEELFHDWHSPVLEAVRATPAERILFHPIDALAGKLPSFVSGRVVLLGDAAHAMTPDLGQGGGQALEDAATLTALLRPFATQLKPQEARLRDALTTYDALRRPRTQRVSSRARMIGRLAHTPGPLSVGIRNMIVRATPENAMRKQLQWLQGWRPPR